MRRSACLAWIAIVFFLNSAVAFPTGEQRAPLGKVGKKVLRDFEHIDSISDADDYLQSARPACIAPSLKAQIIARLPYAGDVGPTPEGRLKLLAIDCVLEYHGRETAFEVKVIHAVQAFIGLHDRSALLISEKALELLTPEELRAAVAHEVGHDYFWTEYRAAARLGDPRKLQEVELRCDAVAVFTLLCLGMDPAALLHAVSKQAAFNQLVGATANANCYISMKERTKFVRALIDRVAGNAEKAQLPVHQRLARE